MSRPKPTKAEQARFDAFRHIGCIVSGSREYEVHHLTDGGRRLGHAFSIPLHPWYHRGVPYAGFSQAAMTERFGPSLAKSKPQFESKFGSELELLELTNKKLERAA